MIEQTLFDVEVFDKPTTTTIDEGIAAMEAAHLFYRQNMQLCCVDFNDAMRLNEALSFCITRLKRARKNSEKP